MSFGSGVISFISKGRERPSRFPFAWIHVLKHVAMLKHWTLFLIPCFRTSVAVPAIATGNSGFLWNIFAFGKKLERGRVEAVSVAGWRRTIREHMSLMTAAPGTADLDASHSVAVVLDLGEVLFVEWCVERRPSRS